MFELPIPRTSVFFIFDDEEGGDVNAIDGDNGSNIIVELRFLPVRDDVTSIFWLSSRSRNGVTDDGVAEDDGSMLRCSDESFGLI